MTYQDDTAQMFHQHPEALAALERYEQRKKAQAAKTQAKPAPLPAGTCPHCGKVGSRVFKVAGRDFAVRGECCQRAIFDDAKAALMALWHPQASDVSRLGSGRDYVAFREKLTDPDLLALLDIEEAQLSGTPERIQSSGGYCQGLAKPKPAEEVQPLSATLDDFDSLFN